MELILALLGAGPIGFLSRTPARALALYLTAWAVVLPIQTVVVFSMSDDGNEPLYWVINALILSVGIALNLLGSRFGASRRAGSAGASGA